MQLKLGSSVVVVAVGVTATSRQIFTLLDRARLEDTVIDLETDRLLRNEDFPNPPLLLRRRSKFALATLPLTLL